MQQAGNDGQTYSNVVAVMRLPNGYEAPQPDGYVRTIHRPQEGGMGMVSAPRSAQSFQQPQPPRPALPRPMQPPFQPGVTQPAFQPPVQPMFQPQAFQPPPPDAQGQGYTQGHDEVTDDDVPF
jgi:hypothetical protein